MSNQVTAATRRKDKSASALVEICSVRLGNALYGMPISHILEIVGGARPQPVPLAPSFVGGLVHYRGDVLTAVSLRQLLRMAPLDGPQDILVLESSGGCFGLLVDSVGEVLTVPSADFEPNPSTLDEARRDLIAGAYKLQNALMVMLDPERLDPVRLGVAEAA
jgi:purine-binding chemotaxis protein CheW